MARNFAGGRGPPAPLEPLLLLSDALCVDDNVTEHVYSYKLLVIVIQCNLIWHAHVDQI